MNNSIEKVLVIEIETPYGKHIDIKGYTEVVGFGGGIRSIHDFSLDCQTDNFDEAVEWVKTNFDKLKGDDLNYESPKSLCSDSRILKSFTLMNCPNCKDGISDDEICWLCDDTGVVTQERLDEIEHDQQETLNDPEIEIPF